jgi:uncharacterized protein (TIGR04255 family)
VVLAKIRHLKNAPIVEAIIDLRVEQEDGFNENLLSELSKEIASLYPICEPRKLFAGSFGVKDGKPINTVEDKGIKGYFCKSKDSIRVAQFRIDGFTFSHLTPYTKWQNIISEAKRLWELYEAKTKPILIEKVATRYINRLDFPLGADLDLYLKAGPKIPKNLPQELNEFFMKIVVPEGDLVANIIQTGIHGKTPSDVSVIIDIEVFHRNTKGINYEEIWPLFDRLRSFKNRIFFAMITEEEARRLA